jgi:hypothetical protein
MGLRIATTAILFLLDLLAFTWLAGRLRRRPAPLAAAIGLGFLVAWQSVVASALSACTAVNGTSLAIAACIPPAVAFLWLRRGEGGLRGALGRGWRSLRWTFASPGWIGALALPLAAVLALVAAGYAPSNWDSMTYHLARVAHWIQRGSVSAYETSIFRQTLYAPGAEYVLLGLQAVSGSDRLANGLQLVAWLVVVGSAAPLARLAGAPRALTAWAGPIVGAAPMLVLQATSTQNDLVAAAMTLAVLAASLPFLHRAPRPRQADLVVLGVALGAALLVKATAVVCAAPFLLVAGAGALRGARRSSPRATAAALLGSLALALAVSGPYLVRTATAGARAEELTAPFVFPLLGEWNARLASVREAYGRHVPMTSNLVPDLKGSPSALPPFHEDLAANPVQAAFAMAGLLLMLLGWRRVPSRARWAGAGVLLAWLLFQVTFRPNPWISRLETPLFALVPLTMGGWAAIQVRWWRTVAVGAVGAAALVLGLAAAVHNRSRPALETFSPRDEAADYYVNRQEERRAHDVALSAAAALGCRRIGLQVGGDSYDYPLTWRAMQRGIEVRHVTGPNPWPCVLVSDVGPPPRLGPGEAPWQPVFQLLSGSQTAPTVVGGVWLRRP